MSEGAIRDRPGQYRDQARTYDYTRGASPTVVRTLAKYLGEPAGRTLLDIAGGTGNYAQVFAARGFRVFVVDAEFAMLGHAARKLGSGRSVVGDAQALPVRDRGVDCAMIVSAFHHFADPLAALGETRRILRGGPLALSAFTRENMVPLFVYDYFDGAWPSTLRTGEEELAGLLRQAGFTRVEHERFIYTDTVDGTIPALHTDAMHLAGPAYLRNTNLWYRIDEDTRRRGLEGLASDLRSGRLEERVRQSFKLATEYGHGTVFAAWP